MPPTFSIEKAKSGRSSCKKCKEKIGKDELRIGTTTERDDISMTSWHHVGCFTLPRALKKEGVTMENFLDDELNDPDGLIPHHREEILTAMEDTKTNAAGGSASKTTKKTKDTEDTTTHIGTIKRTFKLLQQQQDDEEDDDDNNRPSKRMKLTKAEREEQELYQQYKDHTIDELKDYMRWNRQVVGGKKDTLVYRCIDGMLNGRLGRCPLCKQGRLAIRDEALDAATCHGYYDEMAGGRVPCTYKITSLDKAPRFQPWYAQAPTEEEEQQMDDLEEQIKKTGGAAAAVVAANSKSGTTSIKQENSDVMDELFKKAKSIKWKTGNKDEIKATTVALTKIAQDGGVALPSGSETKAVGKLVVMNAKSMTSSLQLLQMVVDEYGLVAQKAAVQEATNDAAASLCTVPANAKFYTMIDELASLMRKGGDFMKANMTKKAALAVAELKFEITKENAMKLGKPGKMKVPGIGKSTAEKMHELITTGEVESLERLRASV